MESDNIDLLWLKSFFNIIFSRFIHVEVCIEISTSFLFVVNSKYSTVWIYHILFIHYQLMNIWVASFFLLLWIMLLWMFIYRFLFGCVCVCFSLGHVCRSRIAGSFGDSILSLHELPDCFLYFYLKFYCICLITFISW